MRASYLLKEARRRASLTQSELAERVGTAQSVIARWEAGDREPGFSTVQKVLRACELDWSIALVPFDTHDLRLAFQRRDRSPGERIEYMISWTDELEEWARTARTVGRLNAQDTA